MTNEANRRIFGLATVVSLVSKTDTFVNHGLVLGTSAAIDGGSSNQIVVNDGIIEGFIDL